MYAFGAMLSFTIAHAAVIQLRRKPPPVEEPYRVAAEPARPRRRLAALRDRRRRSAPALAWLVVVVQDAPTRYAGLALARGRVRLLRDLPPAARHPAARDRARAAPARPGDRARVPHDPRADRRRAASRTRRSTSPRGSPPSGGATIVALRVIVVPLDLPLDAELRGRGGRGRPPARRGARTRRELYGVRTIDRLVRARHAGRAIVDEAERRQTEIVVLGAPRGRHRADLRPDGRLRPQARPVPRDGRRRQEGRVSGRIRVTSALRPRADHDRARRRDARRHRSRTAAGRSAILARRCSSSARRRPAGSTC